jgi:excisionase family DNA binding protein
MNTVTQVAARLGLSGVRVCQLIRAGKLRATRIGRCWIIDDDELAGFAQTARPRGRPRKPANIAPNHN